ncbi:hypothetical protein M0R45_012212 [Rubus argutus]|uniref:Calmodulin-binding domain-containing protein n=1 Tax=Rubus argutus TaxID=59490 RepID=A0AAW1YF62_RUBAR
MATKAKDSTTPGRERKSTTSPAANHTKRPTKPTTPDKPCSTSTSSSTAKPVPNYLRSTASSSRHDQTPPLTKSRSLKKHHGADNQDSNSPKPTLNRRRSFDKPPSPSRLNKSLISPGRESRDPPLRSTTFPVKSISNAPKPTTKSGAGTKPQAASYAKSSGTTSLRRSTSGITSGSRKKQSSSSRTSTSGGSRAPRSRDIVQTLNLEADFEALDHHGVEEVDKIESIEEDNNQDLPDPKLAEEDHAVDSDQAKSPTVHDTCSVKDATEEFKENVDARNEQVTQEEKNLDDQGEEINQIGKGSDIDHHPEEGSGLASEETEAEEAIKEDENKNGEEIEVVDGGSHELDLKEGQDGDVKEEAKAEAVEETAKQSAAAAGGNNNKEAAPSAYNDMIEETASKLMAKEKRKNKVKALVGAFETVIDYESAGSKLT